MYLIEIIYHQQYAGIITKTFIHHDLEYAKKQLSVLKDEYMSYGAKILHLTLYKIEKVEHPEQI